MQIASTTLCYPSDKHPTRGIFVQQRLRAINRLASVKVVAPVPWFPGFRPDEIADSPEYDPPVWRPKMYYLPKFYKNLDSVFYSRALMKGIAAAYPGQKPDLIDAHFEWPDCVGSWIAARKLKLPVVCTLRGKLESQAADFEKRHQLGNMLRCANKLVAVSRYLAGLAERVAEMPLDIAIIPNGVDSSTFNDRIERGAARLALGWDPQNKYVVSVGHLQARKGFDRLISVWPAILATNPDAKLILIGGPAAEMGYERKLKSMIRSLGLDGKVVMTGRLPPPEISLMLRAADLYALWTKSEGWCNSIAEALACGCPVISTNVGGNNEIVTEARLGRLVEYDDDQSMVSALRHSLLYEWDRRFIAEVGGRRTWRTVAAECMALFQEVVQSVKASAVAA